MSRMQAFVCGTPEKECTGTMTGKVSKGMRATKVHDSPEAAYRCHANWLKRQGYTEYPNREFGKPGEYRIVLTKKSRFGARLRKGKEDRFMPERGSGYIG